MKLKIISFLILFSCTAFTGIKAFNALYAVVTPALNNLNTHLQAINK